MGRPRRQIISGKAYEVCFRAREGLPFVIYHLINLIINSVVARKLHDQKVHICHDIWNGSHTHIFLVALDAAKFFKFIGEIQKEITEIIKRLLGLEQLNLWEGTPSVIDILDLDAAIERIAYIYANPAQDNLVDNIEKFPGVSSWNDFQKVGNSLTGSHIEYCPWIRQPTIPRLDSPILTNQQDLYLTKMLKEQNKKLHKLERRPNLWMRSFGITSDEEVKEINGKIIARLRVKEADAREQRKESGKSVFGIDRLTCQPIMKSHKPKKKDRKIYFISTVKELRIRFIEAYKFFCEKCSYCYERWLIGDFSVDWPPGAFKPPIRPSYNVLHQVEAAHFEYL